jgi:hypothetical protein
MFRSLLMPRLLAGGRRCPTTTQCGCLPAGTTGAQHTLGLGLAWAVLPCQSQYILHLLVLLIGAGTRRYYGANVQRTAFTQYILTLAWQMFLAIPVSALAWEIHSVPPSLDRRCLAKPEHPHPTWQ